MSKHRQQRIFEVIYAECQISKIVMLRVVAKPSIVLHSGGFPALLSKVRLGWKYLRESNTSTYKVFKGHGKARQCEKRNRKWTSKCRA